MFQVNSAYHASVEYWLAWLGFRWGTFSCVSGRYRNCVIVYGKLITLALRWVSCEELHLAIEPIKTVFSLILDLLIMDVQTLNLCL